MDVIKVEEQEQPIVSVCIFTYQHAAYIAECIESALVQRTNFPFEILIGEDGSTDGTREICRQYAEKYPGKIRLFLRSREDVIYINGKPTGRFNFVQTMKAAKGKYLALCDGDDYWTDPLKLQKQVDILGADTSIVACHHWQKIASRNAEGKYVEQEAPTEGHGYWPAPRADAGEIFANHLRLKSRTLLFRNIFLDGYQLPAWFFTVQFGDVPLTMILGRYGEFAFINEPMAVYRMTGTGVSTIGIRDELFTFHHYIEWIRIWEYGKMLYRNKYQREALKTIYSFYNVIFVKYEFSFYIFRKMARYAFSGSGLSFFLRLQILFSLAAKFFAVRLKRISGRH